MESVTVLQNFKLVSEPEEPIVTTMVETFTVVPQTPGRRRRLFLSNIDLTLVAFLETVAFFEPPPSPVALVELADTFRGALSRLLVAYDFLAGRLERAREGERLEIDCNGAGIVVVTATCSVEMSQLGELRAPKPAYKELARFLQDVGGEELRDKPLMLFQLTQFKCGGLAVATRCNHCLMDGVAAHEFEINFASFTRGEGLIVVPNSDRSVFKSRDPPEINHPHFEYSKLIDLMSTFSLRGLCSPNLKQLPSEELRLVYISPKRIARLKSEALSDHQLKNCTTFNIIAAKIWKARSISLGLPDERISTVLFPVDVRKRVVPPAPDGFTGNALVPGFARATITELKTASASSLAGKVQEGVERLSDEYVKSGIDWLEVHHGVPSQVDSFSVVAWFKLGLDDAEYEWGRVKCVSPLELYPGLVILLPGEQNEGGINICLKLPPDQMKDFYKLMMED
ncbi:hypothetical protein MRB53_027611 [Persea americana]|uniref:Uncharacterized protein n=1 Tax=Persea americana TaxID=3435 RepID=A0ACC2LLB3_PERAE|nr:hypothetical protein MRB53_027611 [Persea americana]